MLIGISMIRDQGSIVIVMMLVGVIPIVLLVLVIKTMIGVPRL